MKPFRLVSVWALLLGVVLYLAQIPPIPGVILMMFGAEYLTGFLFQIALLALFCEALTRKVPRFLAVIPVLAYGAYYVEYFREPFEIAAKEIALRAEKAPSPIVFDATRFALVRDDASDVVDRYTAPAAYQPGTSGVTTFTSLSRNQTVNRF